jgi:hypothetical protein
MTHEDALRQMAVEQYLLGELSGESGNAFEEHFFECEICAADLKAGRALMDAGKAIANEEATSQRISQPSILPRPRRHIAEQIRLWLLVPALAASLLILIYQNAFVLPSTRRQVARAEAPEVLNSLVLANINARGDTVPEIVAPRTGSFLIAVDIPTKVGFSGYICSLYGPSGSLLWQIPVSSQQAENTVSLRVPTQKAADGTNILVVRGIPATGNAAPVEAGRYRFELRAQQ